MKNRAGVKTILYSYLKSQANILLVLFVCTAVFYFVFYLFDLPFEATGYAGLLSLSFIIVYGAFGFFKYYKKHEMISYKQKSISVEPELDLVPKDIIEEDFLALLKILSDEKQDISQKHEAHISQMKDYYDMWTHQAKVPISAIRLMLDTQNQVDKTILVNEVFKLEQYVDMALYYTRLDNTSSDYVIKKQPLDPIVTKSIKRYSRLFIAKKIKLEYEKADVDVVTDSKWIAFVIEQILSNGIKYTPPSGTISVITIKDKAEVSLIISDTGIGIMKEDIPRIFDKGYTGFNGRVEDKSTGIGLYLCQRIAKNLNVSISVESEIDVGSRFTISFELKNDVLE